MRVPARAAGDVDSLHPTWMYPGQSADGLLVFMFDAKHSYAKTHPKNPAMAVK
jgi:hypothetical protein